MCSVRSYRSMIYQNYNWIDDHLAVGGLISVSEELPFEAILSLETSVPLAVRELATAGRPRYRWLPLTDNSFHPRAEILDTFTAAADQIHAWLARNWHVLVHCHNGISRSVTAVIWYLINRRGYTWDAALAQLRTRRPVADPDIRLEISLRLAADPTLDDAWIDNRLYTYCQDQRRRTGILLDWREIRRELEEKAA